MSERIEPLQTWRSDTLGLTVRVVETPRPPKPLEVEIIGPPCDGECQPMTPTWERRYYRKEE